MFKLIKQDPFLGFAGFSYIPSNHVPTNSLLSLIEETWGTNATRRVEIDEQDSVYVATLELPGFKKEEVDVTLDNQFLVIKAKNAKSEVSKTLDLALWEIDFSKIDARLEHGLLTITLSKTERAKPSKIEIK